MSAGARPTCWAAADNNGKTTYCEIVRGVLGDISNGGYACLSTEKIISANYAGHDTIFAELEKARFVEIPEIGPNLLLGAVTPKLPAMRRGLS